jgi:hypothetical protein
MRRNARHVVIQKVACLECSLVYAKPAAGGTTTENPGCPRCGYVGWIAVRPADDDGGDGNGFGPPE